MDRHDELPIAIIGAGPIGLAAALRELSHPEPGFYTAGIKSYGRAPTFLLLIGYEQVRSIVAPIAGDLKAADEVRFVLPEVGVCNSYLPEGTLVGAASCGGPAPAESACCVAGRPAETTRESGHGVRLIADTST